MSSLWAEIMILNIYIYLGIAGIPALASIINISINYH